MNLTLRQYIDGIESGKFTQQEVYDAYMKKSKEKNPELNAYISFNEQPVADMKETTLKGAPIAIKDNFLVKWGPVTCASKILEGFVATYDATTYSNLVSNGGALLGKTNLDEFAMGGSTENSCYGPSKNPHDITKIPGGSSGGSAVAVAADLCIAALGSDTWWSIRQPASLCGIVWFKPTYGRNSRYGVVAMASSLDQVGVFTKTVEDCVILSKTLAGKDPLDATSIKKDNLNTWDEALAKEDIKDLKIAVPRQLLEEGIDLEVKKTIEESIKKIESLGATVDYVDMTTLKSAIEVYYIVMPAEVSTNLSKFDGIRFGKGDNSFDFPDVYAYYEKVRSEGFGDEAKRRIMLGSYVLSAGYYDAFYNKAQKVRRLIKNEYDKIFADYDLVIGPVSPDVAWDIWAKIDDPIKMYLADIYTIPVNLAGLPAMSLPVGTADGLPVGLHIIANQWQENKIFHLANVLEKELDIELKVL